MFDVAASSDDRRILHLSLKSTQKSSNFSNLFTHNFASPDFFQMNSFKLRMPQNWWRLGLPQERDAGRKGERGNREGELEEEDRIRDFLSALTH